MKPLLIAITLSVVLLSPAVAQTPPSPPTAAAPQDGAASEPKGDPIVERQRNSAAKLAGLVRFVDGSCPDAKPDYDRFKRAIASMGVDIKDLEAGDLMARSLGYTQAYQKDAVESCKKALERFGENGTTLRGLIVRKTP